MGIAEDLLQAHGDVVAIFGGNDPTALGALAAANAAGIKDCKIYGVDGSPDVKSELAKGDSLMEGTGAQSPVGIADKAVDIMYKDLKGKKVKKGLRVIVIPATQKIYLQAMEEGLLRTFIEAGAVVSTPTCGPCLGGYMGILAAGERCVSTTNRNFVGRMGHVDSEVYLASPAVAAASAITGKISSPEEVM